MTLGKHSLGQFILGPDGPNVGIYQGNARLLAKDIPDESIDFILTDPCYDRIEDYRWLAETAMRVLKDDRACLAYCAIGKLPQVHQALLAGGLTYRWRLVTRTVWSNEFHGRLVVGTQECLWYEKGRSKLYHSLFDLQMAGMTAKGNYNQHGKNWGKPIDVITRYVDALCPQPGIVVDFFCGSGTVPVAAKLLGRKWLAFDISQESVTRARGRIRSTLTPIVTPAPTQMTLFDGTD